MMALCFCLHNPASPFLLLLIPDIHRTTKFCPVLSPSAFHPAPIPVGQCVMPFSLKLGRQPGKLLLLCFGGLGYRHAFDSSMIRWIAACQLPLCLRSASSCTFSFADLRIFTNLCTRCSAVMSTAPLLCILVSIYDRAEDAIALNEKKPSR